jgi:DNA end-binding protein Ku
MQAVETVAPVRQHVVTEADETPIERSQLVKGYEYEKDKYVVLEREELDALTPETDRNMQVSEFVKLEEIDPVYFENSYYVAPEKAGVKAYGLLFEALRQTGYVAIAEFAMHRRNHVVVLRPGARGILLHTMFYSSEIRSEDEYPADTSSIGDREVEMAKVLINTMATPFAPEKFRDTYREQLEALIQAKIEGRAVAQAEKPTPAPPDDLVNALQRSLQIVRKPAASTSGAGPGVLPGKKRR